ncbi:MAG: helicase C-terminal domain-containing protein [Actinomycetota bacterium]|nr:helicase C-terminal domain-containing protein [Actinomycetota bacterium]
MSSSGRLSSSSVPEGPALTESPKQPAATRTPTSSFTEWLRAKDDGWLGELLRARPDVARPGPPDFATLAGRLSGQVSISRALDQLDAGVLQVVEALLLLPSPVALTDITAGLIGLPSADLARAIDELIGLGLVWGAEDELRLVEGIRLLVSHPSSLGRPLVELTGSPDADADALVASLAELPADERALVDRLAAGPPLGMLPEGWTADEDPPGTISRLLRRGILARINDSTVELPREIGLAVRREMPFGPARLRPEPSPGRIEAATLTKLTVGTVVGVLQHLEDLLAALDVEPAAVLRSGGIGIREHRRLARAAHVDEPIAALLLELALAAELIGIASDGEHWLPTRMLDVWLTQPLADRWVTLARAWLGVRRQPGLAGRRDGAGRTFAPLSPDLVRHGAPVARRAVLEPLLQTGPGTTWSADDLLDLVTWSAPRRGPDFAFAARAALDEARLLGIVAGDALTVPGRALLGDDVDVERAVAAILPPLIDHILVQPDLSAVAPGPLEPELSRSLTLVADIESSGGATVFRISEGSLRRSLDAGWAASDLHALFARHSRTPVPQTLTYLIDDIARRHGGLRVGAASTYLRSDDETLIAQVTSDRRLAEYGLRLLAPGVLISLAEPDELLEALRTAGYAPAAESAAGIVVPALAARQRAPGRRNSPAPRPTELTSEQRETLVRRMRSGDSAARRERRTRVIPSIPGVTTATILETLHRAIREDEGLWIGYVNADGQSSQRFVEPLTLSGGFLTAYDHRREAQRTFAVHRITSVTVAED